jgi:hypothetical protein
VALEKFKGTVSCDRFKEFAKIYRGLSKGRGWFLNFVGAPMIS